MGSGERFQNVSIKVHPVGEGHHHASSPVLTGGDMDHGRAGALKHPRAAVAPRIVNPELVLSKAHVHP